MKLITTNILRKVAVQIAETAGLIAVDQAVRTAVNHYLARRLKSREENKTK